MDNTLEVTKKRKFPIIEGEILNDLEENIIKEEKKEKAWKALSFILNTKMMKPNVHSLYFDKYLHYRLLITEKFTAKELFEFDELVEYFINNQKARRNLKMFFEIVQEINENFSECLQPFLESTLLQIRINPKYLAKYLRVTESIMLTQTKEIMEEFFHLNAKILKDYDGTLNIQQGAFLKICERLTDIWSREINLDGFLCDVSAVISLLIANKSKRKTILGKEIENEFSSCYAKFTPNNVYKLGLSATSSVYHEDTQKRNFKKTFEGQFSFILSIYDEEIKKNPELNPQEP
jgi:hypothetical protein